MESLDQMFYLVRNKDYLTGKDAISVLATAAIN